MLFHKQCSKLHSQVALHFAYNNFKSPVHPPELMITPLANNLTVHCKSECPRHFRIFIPVLFWDELYLPSWKDSVMLESPLPEKFSQTVQNSLRLDIFNDCHYVSY